MTEFAITLPIYLLFIVGILNLHEIQQSNLIVEQRASAELWADAVNAQTSAFAKPPLPWMGAGQAASAYSSAGELFSVAGAIDTGTNLGGMYADSGSKVLTLSAIPGVSPDSDPKTTLSGILCHSDSHSYNLLNDLPNASGLSGGNFGNIANSVLSATGSRPALAAGIRYGVVTGSDDFSFEGDSGHDWRNYQADAASHYFASVPTVPTDHFFGAGFARLEIGTENAWRDMVRFGWSNIGSGISSISTCN